jgi:hypothetical protein
MADHKAILLEETSTQVAAVEAAAAVLEVQAAVEDGVVLHQVPTKHIGQTNLVVVR